MTDLACVGDPLDLFAVATTWKSYLRSHLRPYLSGDVLEVGAGIALQRRPSMTAGSGDGYAWNRIRIWRIGSSRNCPLS